MRHRKVALLQQRRNLPFPTIPLPIACMNSGNVRGWGSKNSTLPTGNEVPLWTIEDAKKLNEETIKTDNEWVIVHKSSESRLDG